MTEFCNSLIHPQPSAGVLVNPPGIRCLSCVYSIQSAHLCVFSLLSFAMSSEAEDAAQPAAGQITESRSGTWKTARKKKPLTPLQILCASRCGALPNEMFVSKFRIPLLLLLLLLLFLPLLLFPGTLSLIWEVMPLAACARSPVANQSPAAASPQKTRGGLVGSALKCGSRGRQGVDRGRL